MMITSSPLHQALEEVFATLTALIEFFFAVPLITFGFLAVSKAIQFERNEKLWRNPTVPGVHGEFPNVSMTIGRVQFLHLEHATPKGGSTWGQTYRVEVAAPFVVRPLAFLRLRALFRLTEFETDVSDPNFRALLHWFARLGLEVRMAEGVLIAISDTTAAPEDARQRMLQLEQLANRAETLALLTGLEPARGSIESQLRR